MSPQPLASLEEYRRLHACFRLRAPERFNFGHDVVDRWAADQPDTRALWWVGPEGEERQLTFREVADRSNRVANALGALGLLRGEQVMLHLPSGPEWWESMVGLAKADVVAIPATTMLTDRDVVFRLQSAEIDGVITDAAGAERVDRASAQAPGLRGKVQVGGRTRPGWLPYDDVVGAASSTFEPLGTRADGHALIYFTSGTTGPPKEDVYLANVYEAALEHFRVRD